MGQSREKWNTLGRSVGWSSQEWDTWSDRLGRSGTLERGVGSLVRGRSGTFKGEVGPSWELGQSRESGIFTF